MNMRNEITLGYRKLLFKFVYMFLLTYIHIDTIQLLTKFECKIFCKETEFVILQHIVKLTTHDKDKVDIIRRGKNRIYRTSGILPSLKPIRYSNDQFTSDFSNVL